MYKQIKKDDMHSVQYEMRCRNCGEGRQFPQISYYHTKTSFLSGSLIDSEYEQAEKLSKTLAETGFLCDWCGTAIWDVYSIKIDGNPLMFYTNNLVYYGIILDKDEDISFKEEVNQNIPWRNCQDALSKIYSFVSDIDVSRFGSNSLDFGGNAELIISFKIDVDGNYLLNRIEKICFIGFDKNDLLDAIAYANNNMYVPSLPRIPL